MMQCNNRLVKMMREDDGWRYTDDIKYRRSHGKDPNTQKRHKILRRIIKRKEAEFIMKTEMKEVA